MAQVIGKPAPADGADAEDFGWLNTPRDAKIFDFGQGTGLIGRLLTEQSFTNIDGADASPYFCRVARDSGWYQNVREFWFGRGIDQLPQEWIGAYDLVVGSGVFLEGHIPCTGFDDAIEMTKVGGYFVTSIRHHYWENGHEFGYKDKIDSHIAAGKIELLKTWTFMRGRKDNPDPLFAELESFMFVCRRIA